MRMYVQHDKIFDDPMKNAFYNTFHHVAVVVSVLANSTLITCILTCPRKEFGAYRYLLLTFASVDFYYALVHFFVMPIPEAWGNAFFMGAHGYFNGRFAVCWFAGAHSHSFPVLVFHFLYRFLAVKGSEGIRLFNKPWFFLLQIVFVVIIAASWFSVLYFLYDVDDFDREYMEPVLREHTTATSLPINEYSIAVFWKYGTFSGPRWKCIFGISFMAATMFGCYGFMIYAAYGIVRQMGRNSAATSEKTRRLQHQLMRALTYQTILPLITAYAPPLLSMLSPFMGVPLSIIADLSPILCGSHPWIDGCVLLWTIQEYRNMILRGFKRYALRKDMPSKGMTGQMSVTVY